MNLSQTQWATCCDKPVRWKPRNSKLPLLSMNPWPNQHSSTDFFLTSCGSSESEVVSFSSWLFFPDITTSWPLAFQLIHRVHQLFQALFAFGQLCRQFVDPLLFRTIWFLNELQVHPKNRSMVWCTRLCVLVSVCCSWILFKTTLISAQYASQHMTRTKKTLDAMFTKLCVLVSVYCSWIIFFMLLSTLNSHPITPKNHSWYTKLQIYGARIHFGAPNLR